MSHAELTIELLELDRQLALKAVDDRLQVVAKTSGRTMWNCSEVVDMLLDIRAHLSASANSIR